MTDTQGGGAGSSRSCANCHRALDATDNFCRECGLPTLRQAEALRAVPTHAHGTSEPRPGLDVVPDPQPFVRPAVDSTRPVATNGELTTGGVVRVTSPTQATQMAISTVLMVLLIVGLVVAGVVLLVLAFQA
jgi:hypothetical protein